MSGEDGRSGRVRLGRTGGALYDDRVRGDSIFLENHDRLVDVPFTLLAILSLNPL